MSQCLNDLKRKMFATWVQRWQRWERFLLASHLKLFVDSFLIFPVTRVVHIKSVFFIVLSTVACHWQKPKLLGMSHTIYGVEDWN